jgi:5-methylcytosine-specific restriction enzyme subunit McrC
LTADVDENSILLWALHLASRLGFDRGEVRRRVRQAHRALIGDVSLDRKAAADCIGRLYHRLNDDYQPMHGLCRFILEHTGPAIGVGAHAFIPFAVDMPKLFEAFATEWLRQNLPHELEVEPQLNMKLDSNADLTFRVDLVIRKRDTGTPICLIDTKYKLGEGVNEADIQQVVAYAVELGVREAVLLYPAAKSKPISVKVGEISVEAMGFDVSQAFASSGQALLAKIIGLGAVRH